MSLRAIIKAISSSILREDHVCPWWLAYSFDNPLRRWLHDPIEILSSFVSPGITVADIGCGMGYFTVPLAAMVGDRGRVLAVDLQQKMLEKAERRARKRGVADRIRFIKAAKDDIGLKEQVDFALAFWMVHEVDDIPKFFKQISSCLTAGGSFLIVEPKIHVPLIRFGEILEHARQAGFAVSPGPRVKISRSAVLRRK